ncbi:AraC family transcriptional regulator [Paenibacillus sp. GYB004]
MSVETIAQRIGYASSSYFRRVFRSILGVTPHQFRSNEEWSHDHITF